MTLPSWALVIATKDRLAPLKTCVAHALGQSCPPSEVIIIDASAGWEAHRAEIGALVQDHPGIRFFYDKAAQPSAATQRNQGIEVATADILFLIDDDSFLYPGAVEEVLNIYAADKDEAVAGIQMIPAPHPPGTAPEARQQEAAGLETVTSGPSLKRRLLRQLLSYGPQGNFIPYDGTYPDHPIPAALADMNVKPARLFEGFRMTLRRPVAARLKFDPLLLYYSPGEDLDLSYRASQTGALLTARGALVHHFNSGDGRLKRRQIETLGTLNQALFLRRHAPSQAAARLRFTRRILHRAFAGALMDLRQGRFDLPKARGTLRGLRLARAVFGTPLAELDRLYPDMQTRIVKG